MELFKNIQSKRKLDMDEIASKLFSLPVKAHFIHHSTKLFPMHEAMGKLYDGLEDAKDELIEKCIGYTGMRYKTLKVETYPMYSDALAVQVAKEVMMFAKDLEDWAEENGYCDIENLAQSYSGLGAHALYRLTLI
jgi:hypothetical protein